MTDIPKTTATVKITNTVTGESRIYLDEWFDGDTQVWAWSDGNYSCDCNREISFCESHGEETETEECGSERFRVDSIFAAGRLWYSELEHNVNKPC